MITVQPNIESDPHLHAQQIIDACREGHAWAQQVQRTEAEVIDWAAVILRDGPQRMGWTADESREVALAYLEGWTTRPTPAQRLRAAGLALGAIGRAYADGINALAAGMTMGASPTGAPRMPTDRPTRHLRAIE